MESNNDREMFGRRLASFWIGLYVALIMLLSLWPARWNFSPGHVAAQFELFVSSFDQERARLHGLRDMVTNFILYLPLGLLTPWALEASRRGWRHWSWLALGPLLSVAMEAAQLATSRYPNIHDILMNGSGYGLGFMVMTAAMRRWGLSPVMLLGHGGNDRRARAAAALRMIYMPLAIGASLWPFDIAVGAEKIWAKLIAAPSARGHLWLHPLEPWNGERLLGLLPAALMMAPFGFLSRLAHPERGRRAFFHYALLGGLLKGVIELAQIVVLSRTCDVWQVVAGGVGTAAGVGLACWWTRRNAVGGESGAEGVADRSHYLTWGDLALLGVIGWGVALMVQAWAPFKFVPMAWDAAEKLYRDASWLPLRAYYEQGGVTRAARRDLMREFYWYLPLGLLLAGWLGASHARMAWWGRLGLALKVVLILGVGLELGQCMIVGRYVDSTDMLTHAAGGLTGYAIGWATTRACGRKRKSGIGNSTIN